MKKLFSKLIKTLCISVITLSAFTSNADCLLLVENGKEIVSEGDCKTRYNPRCSFNIAISLMGYNEGILKNPSEPEYPFDINNKLPNILEKCKAPVNPTTWLKNSCYWYSVEVTKRLGLEKFKKYVKQFNYGTKNGSGDKGKNNGLTRA